MFIGNEDQLSGLAEPMLMGTDAEGLTSLHKAYTLTCTFHFMPLFPFT